MKRSRPYWGLLRRRRCWVPTWRGFLLLLVMASLLAVAAIRNAHAFLAVSHPVPADTLVVEGWAPDYALREAIIEFKRGHYAKLYVTGGPMEQGAPLSEYKTYAELGAAILLRMGLEASAVQAVPAPAVRQDRTYASAAALREWLAQHGALPATFNVVSVGAHARRSRLLFEKAMGRDATLGIFAVPDGDFDSKHWWKTSQGVRVVTGEAIAYVYARLFFFPRQEKHL